MVLEAKNIKLNNSSKWFTLGQKIRDFATAPFCVYLLILKT